MPIAFSVQTPGRALIDVTKNVHTCLAELGAHEGTACIFVQHTSASLIIQENADPRVQHDLIEYYDRVAPEDGSYLHADEGPDDMPAHIKATLTATSLSVPVSGGRMLLGTWQGIYVFEHRRMAHQRRVIVSFAPE